MSLVILLFFFYLETPPVRKRSIERKPSLDRKQSADDITKPPPAAGLDVEFAKSLRDFFREVRDIQTGMKDMREYGKLFTQ